MFVPIMNIHNKLIRVFFPVLSLRALLLHSSTVVPRG